MWSSSRAARNTLILLAFFLPAGLLSACTGFTPVYSNAAATQYNFAYASPTSRLEQVIYQSLSLRLGKSQAPDAMLLSISASSSSAASTSGLVSVPSAQNEMTVTASFTLTDANGKVLASGTRKASALYTTDALILANQSAEANARERAGKAAAEAIRLTLLGALGNQ